MSRPHLATALAGVLGVALNVVAVIALGQVPNTYGRGEISVWLAETRAAPMATLVSAWSFTIGLVLLAAFVAGLAWAARGPRRAWAIVGATLFGSGALLDAAGTLAPVAALHVDDATATALLWLTLLLDSAFNGLEGLGLLCFAVALGSAAGWPRLLRWVTLACGLMCLPVTLQFHDPFFARLLGISGPLWLAWVTWVSMLLVRKSDG